MLRTYKISKKLNFPVSLMLLALIITLKHLLNFLVHKISSMIASMIFYFQFPPNMYFCKRFSAKISTSFRRDKSDSAKFKTI